MPEPLPNGHECSPLFQQVGRQRLTQAVAAGHDPRGVRIAGHLFLDRLGRQWPAGPLLMPEDRVPWHSARAPLHALAQTGHRIGR